MKTQTEVTHTPTPWTYDGEFLFSGKDRFNRSTQILAEIKDMDNWEANAEFIVRAVNTYENDCVVIGKLGHEVERLAKINKVLLEAVKCAENLPELNILNYTADDVANLNHAVISVIKTCGNAIAQSEGK